MGRIKQNIEIGKQQYWTLFDSGAKNTYIIGKRASGLYDERLSETRTVSLGGKDHSINSVCLL